VYANRQNSGRPRASYSDNNVNNVRVPYIVSIEVCGLNCEIRLGT